MRRRPRRDRLAKPLLIIGGRVLLLSDFLVHPYDPNQTGFRYEEIDVADLPDEAFYFGRVQQGGQTMYILPQARSKLAAYNLTMGVNPSWKIDPSYNWVCQAKESDDEKETEETPTAL